MMRLAETIIARGLTAQEVNLLFALLCLWAACGLGRRPTALLSACLYLALTAI